MYGISNKAMEGVLFLIAKFLPKDHCWRKISTSRQAHNKPNKASLTHVAESEACQSIFLKLTKDEKTVR
jgi:hypothetical protein